MKIITEPNVKLVSAQHFYANPKYELPPHDSQCENIIAFAGKVCYDSYGKDGNKVPQHITNLVGSGHESVLEHAHFGLFIEGISRGCSHEIVRHRMFNYSQRSTRYTEEGDAAIVLDPFYAELFNRDADSRTEQESEIIGRFVQQCDVALLCYKEQVNLLREVAPAHLALRDMRKWCRGKARQLLPHALETRMVMTGNLRAWRHFLIMRSSRHAEGEMRRLAQEIWEMLELLAPNVFHDMVGTTVDGFTELVVVK